MTMTRTRRRGPLLTTRAAATLGVGVALLLALLGCRGVLFSERESRTQFDRYDRSRNNYVPMYTEDEFGVKRPNLEGRLGPRG